MTRRILPAALAALYAAVRETFIAAAIAAAALITGFAVVTVAAELLAVAL